MSGTYLVMLVAWLFCIVWVGGVIYTNRKVHPKALFILFFAELWERFSYYGMRALLVLYMIDKGSSLAYSEEMAYGVYGAYGAMVYATPVIGGLIAERLFGYRKAILWGGILMAAGHFLMAIEVEAIFYIALALLIMGNGFFKPNISSFVGKFYEEGDPRRDGGFTLFYMGINVGAFLTPLTCGVIGQDPNLGWHYGFGLAGIGMMIGLIVFWWGLKSGIFEERGHAPDPKLLRKPIFAGITNEMAVYGGSLLAIPAIWGLLHAHDAMDYILISVAVGMLGYLFFFGTKQEKIQQDKINVILILFMFTTLFWTFFELAGSAISVFTMKNVDKVVMGSEIPTSAFQAVNPAFIILLAPLFSWVWVKMAKRKMEPSTPLKFAFGVLLLGVGFLMFNLGGVFATDGMVPVIWLILAYLLHTMGELCLSPVGLSLVTKLSPARLVGFVMGIWFLSSSLAHQLGKMISQSTSSDNATPVETLEIYSGTFTQVGMVAIGASVILFVLSPMLKRMMHGER